MPAPRPAAMPDFLYGTAWKEDRTPALTELALRMGFRGIDTANQRRHYFEAGVGQGLAAAYRAGVVGVLEEQRALDILGAMHAGTEEKVAGLKGACLFEQGDDLSSLHRLHPGKRNSYHFLMGSRGSWWDAVSISSRMAATAARGSVAVRTGRPMTR